jgi:hypothetical protein
MNTRVEAILANLRVVAHERAARDADPALGSHVTRLKAYQQLRFSRTYADLIASARYGASARFFLEELYGPADFTGRDAQFERVVPSIVTLFSKEVVETVTALSALHALTETLDTAMARNGAAPDWTPVEYVRAWQATGRASDRETQIALTVALAWKLDGMTRSVLLRKGLRLMRTPARAAGLADLQRFLEAGFDTFGALSGAADFIAAIEQRERAFVSALFATPLRAAESGFTNCGALACLPEGPRAAAAQLC